MTVGLTVAVPDAPDADAVKPAIVDPAAVISVGDDPLAAEKPELFA